jgi:uncharacterized membrane protein
MRSDHAIPTTLERWLAALLSVGTSIASTFIAVGLGLALFAGSSAAIPVMFLTFGIVLLILMPVLRVLAMCVIFMREREFLFGAIAALVLAILGGTFLLSVRVT